MDIIFFYTFVANVIGHTSNGKTYLKFMMKKKILFLLMLLCITMGVKAQLLWKISGSDLSKPSYVLGTHHLAPLSIIDSIPAFYKVLDEVDEVYGELVMSEMSNPLNIQKMQQAVVMPGDTTLHTLLTPSQYDSAAVKIKALMGVDLNMLDRMKPSFITSQVAVLLAMKTIKGFNPQQQLDVWVQSEAIKRGKTVAGLETMDFQTQILFNSQSLERQAAQMMCTLMHLDESQQMALKLTDGYMQQNLSKMEEVLNTRMGNDCDPLPEEEEVLIYGRNASWVKQMPAIMKARQTLFVVGSGHLLGERGVLHLLRMQGYKVEAVK